MLPYIVVILKSINESELLSREGRGKDEHYIIGVIKHNWIIFGKMKCSELTDCLMLTIN